MRLVSNTCGIISLLIGLTITSGWVFNIPVFLTLKDEWPAARINSGVCLVLSGFLVLMSVSKKKRGSPWYYVFSILLMLIGGCGMFRYIFMAHASLQATCPWEISFYPSVIFTILGLCFLLPDRKINDHLIAIWPVGAIFFFSLFGILIYIFNAVIISDSCYNYSNMPLYTATGLVITSVGFISSHRESRLVNTLTSKSVGGKILRMVLLPFMFILPFLSFFRVMGEDASFFNTGFGTAVMTVLTLVLFSLLSINLCYRIDAAQLQLVNSETMFRTMVENAREYAIFRLDADGNIITWNKSGERIKGYTASEIIGKHYSIFYTSEEIQRGEPAYNLKTAAQNGYIETEGWRVRKDGTQFYADIVITAIYDPQGNVEGFIKITRDVTSRRNAQEEKNKLIALESKNKELENFIYILTHDVLAPLRNISVISQWLATDYGDKVDERGQEYIRLMNEKISLLGTMIDEVLEYIRAGKTEGEKSFVDTVKLVGDIIKMQSVPTKNHILQIDGVLPTVFASKSALKQIFTNLIDNAIKHNDKENIFIRIGCRDDGDHWTFYVRDNGPGIPSKDRDKVFEIFRTLKAKDETKSTGIGLATVKRNVINEGGSIWIESEPDKGCTFFFTIKKTDVNIL